MPSIQNSEVENVLRNVLANEGYHLSPKRAHGETGVDIIATRDNQTWHIECIGYKEAGSARAKDFYESFFRVVSRLNDGANHLAIALAMQARVGLPARAKQHKVAWERIGRAFPELELWLVDTGQCKYARRTWSEWTNPEAGA